MHYTITNYILTGQANAKTIKTLMEETNLDKDHIKEWIRKERQNRVIIFAPACGYWLPNNPPTIEDYIATKAMVNREKKQAISRFVTMRLAKKFLADNENQLSLELKGCDYNEY